MRSAFGKAVAGDAPQDVAARRQEGVGRCRRMLAVVGKMDQHEIADARRHAQAELRQLLGQPGAASASLCATVRSTWARSRIAATPASIAAALTLNGPRMRLMRVDDVRRRVHPADAQRRQARGSWRRCGSSRRSAIADDQFDAGLVVVAADIFGIGRVEHQEHVLRQAGMQAAHLLERQIGAGRIVRDWRGRRSSSSPSPRRGSRRHRRARRFPWPTTGIAPAAWM